MPHIHWVARQNKLFAAIYSCVFFLLNNLKRSLKRSSNLLGVELEHIKIETRLIDEKFANAMGE